MKARKLSDSAALAAIRDRTPIEALLQLADEMLSVLLMFLKQLETGFKQALQFTVLGVGDEHGCKRPIEVL
jgi:hypothetical protein